MSLTLEFVLTLWCVVGIVHIVFSWATQGNPYKINHSVGWVSVSAGLIVLMFIWPIYWMPPSKGGK